VLKRPLVRCLLLTLAVLALSVGAASALSPGWVRSAGLDVWNVRQLEKVANEAAEQGRQLDEEDAEIRHRIRAKEVLVAELVAGRTTLAVVTSQFRALNEPYPEYQRMIRTHFPGATDEEKMARNVIAYTLPRVPDPSRRHALVRRLDSELHSMLGGRDESAN